MQLMILGLLAGVASAEEHRTPICLITRADTNTGEMLAYSLKEKLRRAAALSLGMEEHCEFSIHMVTVPVAGDQAKIAFSFVVEIKDGNALPPRLLSHSVGTCGMESIDACATGIIAQTDSTITEFMSRVYSSMAKEKAASEAK